jgi:uncharacterized protein
VRHLHLLIAFIGAAAVTHAASDVVISQVYGGGGNTGAQFRNDFIELFNRGDTPVDVTGWSVQYASATGAEWQVTVVTGVIQPGRYLLVQEAAGAGGTTDLPRPDAVGTIAMSATTGKVVLARTDQPLSGSLPGAAPIVDAIGYGPTATLFETTPAPQLSNTAAGLREAGGCRDTDDNNADLRNGTPMPRNSATPAIICTGNPSARDLLISEVQGRGERSPFAGERVTIRGIVTERRTNGYFIQALEPDFNPATSEGLFVFTSTAPPADAAVRNVVEVTGTVSEFGEPANTLTELTSPFELVLIARGAELPAPVELEPGTSWERYESMRVSVRQLTAIAKPGGSIDERTGTASGNGQVYGVLPGMEWPFRTTGAEVHPWLVRVDMPGADPESAEAIFGIEGVLDVSRGAWAIRPAQQILGTGGPFRTRAALPASPGEFTIATMNLQRLFDTEDDPGTSDPIVTPQAFNTRLERIARVIREVMLSPDIIGVEEVENLTTLRALAAAAGDYRAYLEEGNDIGGIDVGFLVKSTMQVLGVQQIGKATTFQFGGRTDLLWDRPPLVLRARVGNSPEFTVIVNHLRSLIDADDPRVMAKRSTQAVELRRIVEQFQTPAAVIGDFNAFPLGEPMPTLTPALHNLTNTLPVDQGFTYIEDGVRQALDHVLLNPQMRPWLTRYTVAHVNAEFSETVRNRPAALERVSDHDFPVAHLNPQLPAVRPAGITNAASWLSGAVAPAEIVSIFGSGFTGLTAVSFNGVPAPVLYRSPTQINALVPDVFRSFTTEVRVGQFAYTMPVQSSAPGLFRPILNQDYSVNSATRPAPRDSTVMLWGTGAGVSGPVTAVVGTVPAVVEYAGAAPGFPAGVFQVNVRVPADAPTGDAVSIRLTMQSRTTQPDVTIAIR